MKEKSIMIQCVVDGLTETIRKNVTEPVPAIESETCQTAMKEYLQHAIAVILNAIILSKQAKQLSNN